MRNITHHMQPITKVFDDNDQMLPALSYDEQVETITSNTIGGQQRTIIGKKSMQVVLAGRPRIKEGDRIHIEHTGTSYTVQVTNTSTSQNQMQLEGDVITEEAILDDLTTFPGPPIPTYTLPEDDIDLTGELNAEDD